MKNAKIIIPVVIVLGLLGWFFLSDKKETVQSKDVFTTVKQGSFQVKVLATGELKAKKSEQIRAPGPAMQRAGVYETTISRMVPEGTVVKPGQFVAQLDQTPLASKINEVRTELEKVQTQLEQALIDTTIDLTNLRDEIKDLEFTKEEKRLLMELNKYEPESVIRQNQIDLERTERDYKKKRNQLKLSVDKARAKIREITTSLKQQQFKLKQLTDLSQSFKINATTEGMVIYQRSYSGNKQGPGSQIRAWNPVVAELPDLTDMIVRAYVNEVDINKLSVGMDVEIQVDALPDNEYTGHVMQVANIGENFRNYDSKVFEVSVQVHQTDSLMRPAMTSAVEVITDTYENVLSVPLESIYRDSLTFVFVKRNAAIAKQEVLLGASNEDEIIIEYGLNSGDQIALNVPDNPEDMKPHYLDHEKKVEEMARIVKDELKRQSDKEALRAKVKQEEITSDRSGGNRSFIIF